MPTNDNDLMQAQRNGGWVLFLLLLLNILNMVDRNLVSSFGPQITDALDLSDTEFGLLTGPIFVTFYAVMGLYVGRLADLMHRPKLIAIGLITWSAFTAISGAARSFFHIGVARLFVGVGEACLTPAAMSMLSDKFPPLKRGFASGIYYLGVPLGAGASYVVADVLGQSVGWRNCFYILGGLGLALMLPLLLIKDPIRGQVDRLGSTANHTSAGEQSLSGQKQHEDMRFVESLKAFIGIVKQTPALAWALAGAVFLHLPIGGAQHVVNWFERERDFTDLSIYGGLFIVFGTLGAVLGGSLSDWFHKRFNGGRLRFLAIFMLCMAPLTLGYRLVDASSPFFYLGMCAGFVSFTAFYGPVFSTVQDLSPPRMRGLTTAMLILLMNLLGLGLGALFVGVLSDLFQTMLFQEPLTWALISVDLFGALSVISFWIGSKHLHKASR